MKFYPGNWLYNAGVIGFLKVLKSCGKNVEKFLKDDGSVEIDEIVIKEVFTSKSRKPPPLDKLKLWHECLLNNTFEWAYSSIEDYVKSQLGRIKSGSQKSQVIKSIIDTNLNFESISFDDEIKKVKEILKEVDKNISDAQIINKAKKVEEVIKPKEHFYRYRKSIGFLFSSGCFYQNLFNPSQFKKIDKFLEKFKYEDLFKNSSSNLKCCFCAEDKYEITPVDLQYMSYLFPATSFPNTYWNLNEKSTTFICSMCKFLTIHHHLALIKLSDNSEIFINAPSFKVMWHLNKYAEVYSKEKAKTVKEILGMSLIQATEKLKLTLHRWTSMNIEVVSKWEDKIDFFSLPYEVAKLISDNSIA
ncbi:MAG: hypothetical protein ACPL1Y_02310, partial [Thermoplasmata archaeon]